MNLELLIDLKIRFLITVVFSTPVNSLLRQDDSERRPELGPGLCSGRVAHNTGTAQLHVRD